MGYILIIAFFLGLLLFLLKKSDDTRRIGEMLLFSSILALLIALAPLTVKVLHG